MKYKKHIILSILFSLVLFITGCNNENVQQPIIMSTGAPLDVVTCFRDYNNNEKCFGYDISLYVEYKSNQITINDALEQKLITLDDIDRAYQKFEEELDIEPK